MIPRGEFIVSLLLLATGGAFILVGPFFFGERHQLYGCRVDYATSITSRRLSEVNSTRTYGLMGRVVE